MRARQEDLRTARLAAHVVNVGTDAVALRNVSRGNSSSRRTIASPRPDHDHVAVLDPLDDAVDDIVDAFLVFVVLAVALGFTHLLHDHLLGRLRRDAPVFQRRQGVGDGIADLRRRMRRRVLQADLVRRIFDGLDHEQMPRQAQLAILELISAWTSVSLP